jgi:hypothetical protein
MYCAYALNARLTRPPHRLKILVIAASDDIQDQIAAHDQEVQRITSHTVDLLSPCEMHSISSRGFTGLHLAMDSFSLGWIHHKACGLPRQLHEICSSVAKTCLSNKETDIAHNLQRSIRSMHTYNDLSRSYNELKARLDAIFMRSALDLDEAFKIVSAHQLLFATPPNHVELGRAVGMKSETVDLVAKALIGAGLAFRVDTVSEAGSFEFNTYNTKLCLRFGANLAYGTLFDTRQYKRTMESYSCMV